jgi:hypothetical protein
MAERVHAAASGTVDQPLRSLEIPDVRPLATTYNKFEPFVPLPLRLATPRTTQVRIKYTACGCQLIGAFGIG